MSVPLYPLVPEWDAGSGESTFEPNRIEQPFGDGYSQRALKGINYKPMPFAAVYTNISQAQVDSITAFCKLYKGGQAVGVQPTGVSTLLKFKIDKWVVTPVAFDIFNMTVAMTQVFDV